MISERTQRCIFSSGFHPHKTRSATRSSVMYLVHSPSLDTSRYGSSHKTRVQQFAGERKTKRERERRKTAVWMRFGIVIHRHHHPSICSHTSAFSRTLLPSSVSSRHSPYNQPHVFSFVSLPITYFILLYVYLSSTATPVHTLTVWCICILRYYRRSVAPPAVTQRTTMPIM